MYYSSPSSDHITDFSYIVAYVRGTQILAGLRREGGISITVEECSIPLLGLAVVVNLLALELWVISI